MFFDNATLELVSVDNFIDYLPFILSKYKFYFQFFFHTLPSHGEKGNGWKKRCVN